MTVSAMSADFLITQGKKMPYTLYTVYPNICGQYGRSLHSGQLLYLKTRSPIISAAEEGADLPRRKEDS